MKFSREQLVDAYQHGQAAFLFYEGSKKVSVYYDPGTRKVTFYINNEESRNSLRYSGETTNANEKIKKLCADLADWEENDILLEFRTSNPSLQWWARSEKAASVYRDWDSQQMNESGKELLCTKIFRPRS